MPEPVDLLDHQRNNRPHARKEAGMWDMTEADWEFYISEYESRWRWLEWLVCCDPSAECHTMDVLMGCGTPPVARVDDKAA